MENEIIKSLSKYRYEKALSNINIAKDLYKLEKYEFALNRAYYSAFDAMRAINALNNFDSGKHSGVISHFNFNYVKTGIFPTSTSDIIKKASTLREKSDYEDFFEANKEETASIISSVEIFLKDVETYLKSKNIIE